MLLYVAILLKPIKRIFFVLKTWQVKQVSQKSIAHLATIFSPTSNGLALQTTLPSSICYLLFTQRVIIIKGAKIYFQKNVGQNNLLISWATFQNSIMQRKESVVAGLTRLALLINPACLEV